MKVTVLSGLLVAALAGYGAYDYTRPAPANSPATEELAKIPPSDPNAKYPSNLSKIPPADPGAKEPENLGTILD